MKLAEKIVYCRKKAGLSQEALAEQIAVSRQSVSKWETGDAVPEINKLLLIANAFGVTTDWLLNDEDPAENAASEPPVPETPPAANHDWVNAVPGMIGRLLRRYGWLFGIYLAFSGAAFTGLGALARYMVRSMTSNALWDSFPGETVYFDQYGAQINSGLSISATTNNPVSIMGTAIMVLGIIMLIAGIVLAVVLKNRSTEQQ